MEEPRVQEGGASGHGDVMGEGGTNSAVSNAGVGGSGRGPKLAGEPRALLHKPERSVAQRMMYLNRRLNSSQGFPLLDMINYNPHP